MYLQGVYENLPAGAALCCVGRLLAPGPPYRSVLVVGRCDSAAPCPLVLAASHDLDPLLCRLSTILHDSHASMQGVGTSQAAKVAWWKQRLQLDGRVDALRQDMQQHIGTAGCAGRLLFMVLATIGNDVSTL